MKILIQRVKQASVEVHSETVGSIKKGLLALVGIEASDTSVTVDKALKKLLNYRVFSDEQGRMNLSLLQIEGELLLVSQFTLVADTQKGLRPSFSRGASPEQGEILFNEFVGKAKSHEQGIIVATGIFGADMQVSLQNDGPVTFLLEIE